MGTLRIIPLTAAALLLPLFTVRRPRRRPRICLQPQAPLRCPSRTRNGIPDEIARLTSPRYHDASRRAADGVRRVRSAPTTRSRRRATLCLAVIGLGLTACSTQSAPTSPVTAPSASRPDASIARASSTPTSSSLAHAVAQTATLAHGTEASRDAIPWDKVDEGWNLASWADVADLSHQRSMAPTLYLLNPIGGRYKIATLPTGSTLALWSPDRKRAVIRAHATAAGAMLQEWDLTTGQLRMEFASREDSSLVGYTRPLGRALLLSHLGDVGHPPRLERVGTDGRHQQDYPTSATQVGAFDQAPALYTPDGLQLVLGAQRGLVVLGNDGEIAREIPLPQGYEACIPRRWWSDRVALVVCTMLKPITHNLWLFPIGGGAPSALTRATDGFGYVDAWRFSTGTMLERGSGCGPGELATLNRDGTGARLSVPLPLGVKGRISVVGVHGDQATFLSTGCAPNGRSLFSYNLVTGSTSVLLGPGLNGGTVF
jgi:hypothetical protein